MTVAFVSLDLLGFPNSHTPKWPVVLGGIIPETDIPRLMDLGVDAVFGPGSDVLDMTAKLLQLIERRHAAIEPDSPNKEPRPQISLLVSPPD